jgi:phosphoglycolate phosphatase-like HAD superfamily hydrolase
VPRHTFSALLGAVTALGEDNARAFDYLRPGFDVVRERRLRELAGRGEQIEDGDLYPDVRPTLGALREQGLRVGIAGNQTARAAELLRALELPADAVATSAEWGAPWPSTGWITRPSSSAAHGSARRCTASPSTARARRSAPAPRRRSGT